MERSHETLAVDPGYLQFFGLTRTPFAAVAYPGEQFQSEQYQLLIERMEFAAANADSLLVVCGADGSGKSTLINRFMCTLQEGVSCVLIDAAVHQGVVSFYRTFLQQIGFDNITGTASELGNITKEFLVCRGIASDHVLVILDNTHLVDPRVLEQLRKLCDIRIKDRRAISVVLFGNADIVRVVDSPAMRQSAFASHVVFNIRSFSEQDTADYIRHRLELAGTEEAVEFPEAVCSLIHRYSGGIPRRINKLGADALEEARRVNSRSVTTEIVRAVINRQRLLPHLTLLTGKGRRRSDPKVEPHAVADAAGPGDAPERVAALQARIDSLEAARVQAVRDVEARNQEIQSLREELGQSRQEAEKLSRAIAAHAATASRHEQALSERVARLLASEREAKQLAADLTQVLRSRDLLQERLVKGDATLAALEQMVQRLRSDLETERTARVAAEQGRDQAMATALELGERVKELQGVTDRLDAELKSSRERVFSAYALEHYVADLQKALEERTSELNARVQAVADLEGQVRNLRNESESIRIRTLIERSKKVEPVRRREETKPAEAKRSQAPSAVAVHQQSLEQVAAYRLLREFDPGFYEGWLKEYQVLVGQGLSDKQLDDALRASQARWMKRHLAFASDQTVVAYIRLLIDQIDEFLEEGAEPCLSFLVPQPRPARGVALDYSRRTARREIELLEAVLVSQDARRQRPKESDVWPDLDPIFTELFRRFGADNVAAIENSFDPGMDRALLCNVSKTLFLRILALPEPRAAAALRWVLVSK